MKPASLGIVMVSHRPGGTERAVLRLLKGLDRARFEPHMCLLGPEAPLTAEYRAAGVPVEALGARGVFDAGRLLGLRRWLRALRPDLIHSYLFGANVAARLLGTGGPHPPIVISIRGVDFWKRPLHHALERALWPRARAVLANSCAAAAEARRRYGSGVPVRVIHNGMEPFETPSREAARTRLGLSAEAPVVLCVANFIRYKRHEELIFAFQQVRASLPGAQLMLVGTGSRLAPCEALAGRLGLDGAVRFVPPVDDVSPLYAACDVVALASDQESYPNTLIEAALAGRPAVATRVGGVPEVVVDGVTGLLVPPLEARPMAQALISLLEDPERREALGAAARDRATTEFSMSEEIRRTGEFYDAVLEGRI